MKARFGRFGESALWILVALRDGPRNRCAAPRRGPVARRPRWAGDPVRGRRAARAARAHRADDERQRPAGVSSDRARSGDRHDRRERGPAMSRLVRLYPQAWRDRYEDEFIALLEERPPTPGDRLDIVRGASTRDCTRKPHTRSTRRSPRRSTSPPAWRCSWPTGGVFWLVAVFIIMTAPMNPPSRRMGEASPRLHPVHQSSSVLALTWGNGLALSGLDSLGRPGTPRGHLRLRRLHPRLLPPAVGAACRSRCCSVPGFSPSVASCSSWRGACWSPGEVVGGGTHALATVSCIAVFGGARHPRQSRVDRARTTPSCGSRSAGRSASHGP